MSVSTERIAAELDAIVAEQNLPGAIAAAAFAGSPESVAASGFADKELRTPMRTDSILLSASIGKSFVAATAMLLRVSGALDLDERIAAWFGDDAWFARLPNGRDITVRMLLNHSSGIPDHIYQPECLAWRGRRFQEPDVMLTPEQMISYIVDKPPLFPAGRGFAYSDTAYILAGMILERVTKRPYYDLLEEYFLVPMQLDLTKPAISREIPSLASGYWLEGGPFGRPKDAPEKVVVDGRMIYHPGSEWTGGGLSTNPRDLTRWALALYGGNVFADGYLDELLTPNADIDAAKKRVGGAYGLGVIIRETEFGPCYGHTGGMPGFSGFMSYYAAHEFSVSMQVNQTSFDIARAEKALVRAALY